jgi:hypothetical protein
LFSPPHSAFPPPHSAPFGLPIGAPFGLPVSAPYNFCGKPSSTPSPSPACVVVAEIRNRGLGPVKLKAVIVMVIDSLGAAEHLLIAQRLNVGISVERDWSSLIDSVPHQRRSTRFPTQELVRLQKRFRLRRRC